jgi:putative NADH-flavin reductase
MEIIVFGSSGKAGSQIVSECLKKGYAVTAFTRQADFPLENSNLRIFQGALTNQPHSAFKSLAHPTLFKR